MVLKHASAKSSNAHNTYNLLNCNSVFLANTICDLRNCAPISALQNKVWFKFPCKPRRNRTHVQCYINWAKTAISFPCISRRVWTCIQYCVDCIFFVCVFSLSSFFRAYHEELGPRPMLHALNYILAFFSSVQITKLKEPHLIDWSQLYIYILFFFPCITRRAWTLNDPSLSLLNSDPTNVNNTFFNCIAADQRATPHVRNTKRFLSQQTALVCSFLA